MSRHRVRFTLNGAPVEVTVPAERLLVDLLREDLGKTGTKDGCSVGVCGLCTVQIDGAPMSACLLLATQVDGAAVRTIEGLASPLQDAIRKLFQSSGRSGRAAKNFLHGSALGHPLHPALIDLPLGAWSVAAISRLLWMFSSAPPQVMTTSAPTVGSRSVARTKRTIRR